MARHWIEALKIYNENKEKFCIPKKGSDDYNNVIKIMNDLKEGKEVNEVKAVKEVKCKSCK